MRFYSVLLCVSLLPAAFARPAAALRKRDVNKVVQDIADLVTKVNALSDVVTSYNDGNDIDTALNIQEGALDLFNQITNTTKDVNELEPLNEDDSIAIGLPFINAEQPILDLLSNIESKKPVFDTSFIPIAPILINDLKDEKAAADELGEALKAKLTEDIGQNEPTIIGEIDAKFDEVIAAFMEDGSSS